MKMNFLNVNVRHENKSNSLILLYYDVLLMMVFMKVKSFKTFKSFVTKKTFCKLFCVAAMK